MDSLLSKHRAALKSLGAQFIKGYIDLVEGEKDPRNLVYIFAMDRVILIEWELDSQEIESFFDITYCYFPITFRPPPDDPYGISTNSLRLALRRALSASPLLAPHALPLLIEKLQASGGNAKRDALETLEEALPVFGRSAALAHAQELWQSFRIEIMHATDDATSICSARALQSLLYVLYAGVDQPTRTAPDIVADMLDELEEPAKQQSKPASTILAVMIQATPGTAQMALFGAVEQLLTMYKEPNELSARAPILQHINTLVKAMRETYEDKEEKDSDDELRTKEEGKFTFEKPSSSTVHKDGHDVEKRKAVGPPRTYQNDARPLDKFRDQLVATLSHALKTHTTRLAAVDLFVSISHIGVLDEAELQHLCQDVNEMLIDPNADNVRIPALEGLRDLGNRRIVENTTLPLLFSALPDRILGAQDQVDKVKSTIRYALGSLSRLCDAPDFFELLVVRMETKLDLLCATEFHHSEELEANIGYARGVINTLSTVLQVKMQAKHRDTGRYGVTIVPRLLGIVLEASLRPGSSKRVASDRRVIKELGSLITLLVQCLDTHKQQDLARPIYAALSSGNLRPLSEGSSALRRLLELEPTLTFDVWSPSAQQAQRDTLHCFASAIIALRRDIPLAHSKDSTSSYLSQLLSWTLDATSRLQEEGGSWLLANAVNKYVEDKELSDLKTHLDSTWAREVDDKDAMEIEYGSATSAQVLRRRRRVIRVWLVIARAFLVKNSRQGESMVSNILGLFDGIVAGRQRDISILREAARGLGGVMREDHVLCKENGSTIRLLYRQRFVTFVLPRLLAGHKNAMTVNTNGDPSSLQRNVYLVAICSLLPSLPKATLLERLSDLFPLLILALDVEDDGIVQASAANVITLAAAVGKRELDEAVLQGRTATALRGEKPQEAPQTPLHLVAEHINSVIRRLLRVGTLTSNEHEEGVAAKCAALRSLSTIARTVDYTTLHPHRMDVLRELGARGYGIDDGRRAVRLEAVDARDAWFRLKSGEEEEQED